MTFSAQYTPNTRNDLPAKGAKYNETATRLPSPDNIPAPRAGEPLQDELEAGQRECYFAVFKMPRRPIRKPTQGPFDGHAPTPNHCRAVVRVDGTDIRKKIKRDYEKALRDLETSRRALDHFHQTDQPQFNCWLTSRFGALLTELRELQGKLAADEALVFMVQSEMMFGGGSYAHAYQRVMARQANPEPPPPPGGEGERDPFGPGPAGEDPEDDTLKGLFNEIFGEFGPDEDPRQARGDRSGPRTTAGGQVHPTKRLKEPVSYTHLTLPTIYSV